MATEEEVVEGDESLIALTTHFAQVSAVLTLMPLRLASMSSDSETMFTVCVST